MYVCLKINVTYFHFVGYDMTKKFIAEHGHHLNMRMFHCLAFGEKSYRYRTIFPDYRFPLYSRMTLSQMEPHQSISWSSAILNRINKLQHNTNENNSCALTNHDVLFTTPAHHLMHRIPLVRSSYCSRKTF